MVRRQGETQNGGLPVTVNTRLYDTAAVLLEQVGVPKHLVGFEVLQDVMMLYVSEPEWEELPLAQALEHLYGDGEPSPDYMRVQNSAMRGAISSAFRKTEKWVTLLSPAAKMPETKQFCHVMAKRLSQAMEKE